MRVSAYVSWGNNVFVFIVSVSGRLTDLTDVKITAKQTGEFLNQKIVVAIQ